LEEVRKEGLQHTLQNFVGKKTAVNCVCSYFSILYKLEIFCNRIVEKQTIVSASHNDPQVDVSSFGSKTIVEMFLTCCGWGRVFSSCRHGGSHLSKVCSKRTKRHQPNRCRYFACSDSVQGKDYNGLRASKIANLLQTIDLDELRKELRMNLENALRKAKNKGELKLTEDELRILDKLEV